MTGRLDYGIFIAGWLACTVPVRAVPPALTRAVPSDAAAAYFWEGPRPADESGSGQGTTELAATIIDTAVRVGALSMVDPAVRPWIDGVAASTVAARHPFALILFDLSTTPVSDSHRLSDLRAALVILTGENHDAVERRIQHLLASYTNMDHSRLKTQRNGTHTLYTLRDDRLPEWTVFTWGAVGAYYVVTVGEGSFDQVVDVLTSRRMSLADSRWFRQAARDLAFDRSAAALYLQPPLIVRDADEEIARKLHRIRAALHLLGTRNALATVRRDGRVVTIETAALRNGITERNTLAGGALMHEAPTGVIPDDATRCTVIDWKPREMLRSIQSAVLAGRSPSNRERIRAFWRQVERESGVSFDRDIAARLGHLLIIHNSPPHALNLPLAWTYVIPIADEPDRLRERLDTLLEYTRTRLGSDATLRLHHDPDGVWRVQMGINGPALAVTERAVIISFSPVALRANLPGNHPRTHPASRVEESVSP